MLLKGHYTIRLVRLFIYDNYVFLNNYDNIEKIDSVILIIFYIYEVTGSNEKENTFKEFYEAKREFSASIIKFCIYYEIY